MVGGDGRRPGERPVLASPGAVLEAAGRLAATGDLQEHLADLAPPRHARPRHRRRRRRRRWRCSRGCRGVGENLVDANVQMLRAMPILALVPLAIVWFGIGEEVKILLVALGVTFPMYLNTHAAIRGVDSRFLDLAATVGLGRLGLMRRVVLPGRAARVLHGPAVRGRHRRGWSSWSASRSTPRSGIGFLMTQARGLSQTDVIMVGLLVYALLGPALRHRRALLERRALRWRSTLQAR